MNLKDRIILNPEILAGKPVIKGTRISVEFILELLSNGWKLENILKNYPQLKKDDILAAINYANRTLKEERIYPLLVKRMK